MRNFAVTSCVILAALALGCVRTTDDFAKTDLRSIERDDDMVLVGTVQVVTEGVDRTEHASFEAEGISGSFQLPASGAVIWITSQHRSEEPVYLSWIAEPYSDDALGLRNRVILARGDPSGAEHCWYFGKVTVSVNRTVTDDLAAAVVGWAHPMAVVTQVDNDNAHRAELARRYPSLSGLNCMAASSDLAVSFP